MFKQVMMSVEDFSKIPDNPIQRDTAKHGNDFSKKPYGHLSEFHPTHIKVAMAITPDGKQKWKLDGHTRCFCIQTEKLEWPKGQKFAVDVWVVKDEDEAIQFFECYDGFSGSKKTGSDKLFGAYRKHKFEPRNPYMFRETGQIRAMNALVFEKKWGDGNVLTHVHLVEPWMPTLRMIDDNMDPYYNHVFFPAPVTAALLCTVRAYGLDAIPFWQLYHDEHKSLTPTSMDAVYKAHDLLEEFKNPIYSPRSTGGGRSGPVSRNVLLTGMKVVHCVERWMRGSRFKVKMKRGQKMWEDAVPLMEWWAAHLGEFDHPTIRAQQDLEI